MTDAEEGEDREWDDLSGAEQDEVMVAEMCGLPLAGLLEALPERDERREFIGTYAMLKIGTAATEVFEQGEFADAADRAELAIILIELLMIAARDGGAHRHKLASGLRALARDIGN